MSRRSQILLLVLLAAAASVSGWLLRSSVLERTVPDVPGTAAPIENPSTITLAGARLATPEAAGAHEPASDRGASSGTLTRSVAEIDPDSELANANWVTGRVLLPPETPADEHAVVLADGAKFERRPLFQSPLAADGEIGRASCRERV